MLAKLRTALPEILIDAAGLGGAALVSFGTWLIYPPAGFIVAGVLLIAGAVLVSLKG